MRIHTSKYLEFFTEAKGGGCHTVATLQLEGFTLVDNADPAKLRHVASCTDPEPIPQHILDVLAMCAEALGTVKTARAMEAKRAIRDLLRAAPT